MMPHSPSVPVRTAARKPSSKDQLLWFVLLSCIALVGLGFLPLAFLGTPFLKPIHIFAAALLLLTPTMLPGSPEGTGIVRMVAFAFFTQLAVLLVSLAWSPLVATGALSLMISFSNCVIALAFCLMASRLSLTRLADLLAYGAFAGAVAFHLSLFVGHALSGHNAISVLSEAAAGGDLRNFKALYFVGGMKGRGVEGVASFVSSSAPKATNSFGSAFVTTAIAAVHVVAADRALTRYRSVKRDWAVWLALINAVFVIMIAFSDRVQIYGALLIIAHLSYFGFMHGNWKLGAWLTFGGLWVSLSAIMYIAVSASAQGTFEEYAYRIMNNPRFTDLDRVLVRLGELGMLGGGMGIPLSFSDTSYLYPHNLFLFNYLSAGMIGLLASFIWFGVLCLLAVKAFALMINQQMPRAVRRLALGAFSGVIYVITLTQLVSQGDLDLADWLGLAIALSVLAKAQSIHNRMGAQSLSRPSPVR